MKNRTHNSFSWLNVNRSLAAGRGYGDAASDLHTLVFLYAVKNFSQVDSLSYPVNDRSTAGQPSGA